MHAGYHYTKAKRILKRSTVVVLLIFFLTVLLLLVWLLVMPIELRINTNSNLYFLRWKSIANVRLIPVSDDLLIRFWILFWRKEISLFEYKPKKKLEKPPKKAKKKKARKLNFRKWKRKGMRILRSFEVKAFRLNLDTDDYIQNSYLYPLFHFLSTRTNRQFKINYEGETELILVVRNRPIKILTALLF